MPGARLGDVGGCRRQIHWKSRATRWLCWLTATA